MILESDVTVQSAVRWLDAEADKIGISARFLSERADIRPGQYYTFLRVPVVVDDDPTGENERRLITTLESEWNFQDPPPEKMLSLIPAWAPENM